MAPACFRVFVRASCTIRYTRELDCRAGIEALPHPLDGYLESRGTDVVEEILEPIDRGCRHELGICDIGAKHADEAPHVRQSQAAHGGHLLHGFGRPGRIRLADDGGGVGQRDHDRQAVSHDVVHLSCYAGALGSRAERCLLTPLDLEALGALGQPAHVLAARPNREAGEEGGHDRGREEEKRPGHGRRRPPARGGHHGADLHDGGRQQGSGARLVNGHCVQRQ